MPTRRTRVARLPAAACLIVLVALCGALAAGRVAPGLLAAPQLQPAQSPTPVPPLVLDAVAIDKKGTRCHRPEAFGLRDRHGRQAAPGREDRSPVSGSGCVGTRLRPTRRPYPARLPPLAEPSRVIVIAADQGSFLPGDERRTQLIAENLLGLVALGDRVMFVTLPDLKGTQTLSVERDPMRQGLAACARCARSTPCRQGRYHRTAQG